MSAYEELPGDPSRGRFPVVLLHAILSTPEDWRRVASRLAHAGRGVVLARAATHGQPQEYAEEVIAFLRARCPRGAHVVGHSRGGTAASWIAVEAPDLVRSLAVVSSPPQPTEAFRATFRRRLESLPADAPEETRAAYAYLARIPEDDFPMHAMRRVGAPALVVEAGDDAIYSPTDTLFWRMFLPYAAFERVEGGHSFFAASDEGAAWLARRLLTHVDAAEASVPPA